MTEVERSDAGASQGTAGLMSSSGRWKETRKGSPLQLAEVGWPCHHLDFILSLQNMEMINFCSKPPSLWHCGMAALGSQDMFHVRRGGKSPHGKTQH